MDTIKSQLLAYAQLLRLPNVFTAFADICLAGAVTGLITNNTVGFLFASLASGSLYLGGMVWNDVFDRHEDAKTQRFRPIPSGRVGVKQAVILGVVLLVAGCGFAYLATQFSNYTGPFLQPMVIVAALVIAIVLYNYWLKHTLFGPIAMGSCRSLNVLFGLSLTGNVPDELLIHIPAIIGVYIVGVTWFARTEETQSQRRQLTLASCVIMAAILGGLSLTAYTEVVSFRPYPYLIVIFGFIIGMPIAKAIQQPEPKHVQAAVKRCILGLIVFDAVLSTAFVGWPGLLILLLLVPAIGIGRWVYST